VKTYETEILNTVKILWGVEPFLYVFNNRGTVGNDVFQSVRARVIRKTNGETKSVLHGRLKNFGC
jgi:hypothetical protein